MSAVDIAHSTKSVTYHFTPKTRVRRAARLMLLERFDSMWVRMPYAVAGDPEAGIHEMRVEAKRLREAMRLFGTAYRASEFKLILAEVDRLNDLLGHVRDADVLVERCATLAAGPATALIGSHNQAVQAARDGDLAALTSYLQELQGRGFEGRFRRMARVCRHSPSHAVAGRRLKGFAPLEVGRRLRKVVTRLRLVQGEDDGDGLHAVRVANKHLRYAMEAFLGIYDRRFEQAHKRVVELHKALGDIHDLDVLSERLQTYAIGHGGAAVLGDCLEAITVQRGREYGRVRAYLSRDGIDSFAHQVMDALE